MYIALSMSRTQNLLNHTLPYLTQVSDAQAGLNALEDTELLLREQEILQVQLSLRATIFALFVNISLDSPFLFRPSALLPFYFSIRPFARSSPLTCKEMVDELERRRDLVAQESEQKERALGELRRHAEEGRQQAAEALAELEALSHRLVVGREDLRVVESSRLELQREAVVLQREVDDCRALSAAEQKTLSAMRSKLDASRQELQQWESAAFRMKEQLQDDERKGKTARTQAMDQIRQMQAEFLRLQSDYSSKQRSVEELEKYRKTVEEELECRRRDLEQDHVVVAREVEELQRRASAQRSECRTLKLETDALAMKKRQLDLDVSRTSDSLVGEVSRLDEELAERKHTLEHQDSLVAEAEKRLRALREKVAGSEAEQRQLRVVVAELRRQQGDLEKSAEERRRAIEAEAAQAASQVQWSLLSLPSCRTNTNTIPLYLRNVAASGAAVTAHRSSDNLSR